MNTTEKEVIRNVIRRLRCAESPRHTAAFGRPSYGECERVRYTLTGSVDPARILRPAERERLTIQCGPDNPGSSARIYLETWVIGALEALLDEDDGGTGRDLELARDLSR
jgi:hypothetical protein